MLPIHLRLQSNGCWLTMQALQLLEYIIKHGSERVVDDARSHISTIKMLRNFHYIDEKGKDQGINGVYPNPIRSIPRLMMRTSVRNRAKELADLLSDVERIRAERRKAKAKRNKSSTALKRLAKAKEMGIERNQKLEHRRKSVEIKKEKKNKLKKMWD